MGAESSLRDRFERGLAAPICLTWSDLRLQPRVHALPLFVGTAATPWS